MNRAEPLSRVVIYAKDVQCLLGKSERHARYVLERIRYELRKEKHHVITVTEFCEYMGMKVEEVERVIRRMG